MALSPAGSACCGSDLANVRLTPRAEIRLMFQVPAAADGKSFAAHLVTEVRGRRTKVDALAQSERPPTPLRSGPVVVHSSHLLCRAAVDFKRARPLSAFRRSGRQTAAFVTTSS